MKIAAGMALSQAACVASVMNLYLWDDRLEHALLRGKNDAVVVMNYNNIVVTVICFATLSRSSVPILPSSRAVRPPPGRRFRRASALAPRPTWHWQRQSR